MRTSLTEAGRPTGNARHWQNKCEVIYQREQNKVGGQSQRLTEKESLWQRCYFSEFADALKFDRVAEVGSYISKLTASWPRPSTDSLGWNPPPDLHAHATQVFIPSLRAKKRPPFVYKY